MLQGYGHTLLIVKKNIKGIKENHCLIHDSGLCTSNKKWIKTKIKTHPYVSIAKGLKSSPNTRSVYGRVFSWIAIISAYVIIVDVQYTIFANQVSNDNIRQSLETIYANEDIHSSSNVAREKVWDLHLNMCSTFQNNSRDNIPKCIMGYYMFIPAWASKQMGM
jgi:hypothetical protein